jgi:serine/threonine protein kinase/tetratricopeptide (TPR) repeat protein
MASGEAELLRGARDDYLLLPRLYREDFRRMLAQCGYHRPWPDGERLVRTATSWEEHEQGRAAIGRGANGLVCYGYAVQSQRYIAIKIPLMTEEQPDVAGLPNAHGVIDRCGDGLEVTELVGLGTVEQLAERLGQLDDQEFRDQIIFHLTFCLLRSLAGAHARDLFHRDIKPDNLLLNHQGDLLVSDFGGATIGVDGQIMEDGKGGGFVGYKSPEATYCILHQPGKVGGAAVDGWAAALTLLQIAGYNWARQVEEVIFPFTTHANVDQAEFERAITTCIESCPPLEDPAPNTIWALIKEMLAFDPKLRLTPKSALAHPWVAEMSDRFAPHRERVLSLLREFVQGSATSTLSPQNIPMPSFENYIPRPGLEADLLGRLQGSDPIILQGLPGVGKSKLALRLLHTVRDQFGLVLWFNGEQFEQQLRIFLEEMGLPVEDPYATARQFFGSFEKRFGVRWLMVVDNAPGKEVLMPGGKTIITAREGWDGAQEVCPLGDDQAHQLVARLLQQEGDEVDRLCRHFANLPLGLVYACAHIRHHGGTIDDYIESVRRVAGAIAGEERSYGQEIPRTMAAQHALMLERLTPGGAQLLQRLACLATDHIDQSELDTFDQGGASDELRSLALLQEDRPALFSMHRLLQEMVWGKLDESVQQDLLSEVMGRWIEWDDDLDLDWRLVRERQRLLPHLEASAALATSISVPSEGFKRMGANLMLVAGIATVEAGFWPDEAVDRAEKWGDSVWGGKSIERAKYLNVLAMSRSILGYEHRRQRLLRAMTIVEPHAGAHPALLANLHNNLAMLELETGNRSAAIEAMSRALALRQEAFGERSLWVAHSYRNLAVYVETPEEGIRLADEAIAICRERGQYLREDVASAWHTKGTWIGSYGPDRDREAIECIQKAVDIWRVDCPAHPTRCVGLSSLFTLFCNQGDRSKALDTLREKEELCEYSDGPRSVMLAHMLVENAGRLLDAKFDPNMALARLVSARSILESDGANAQLEQRARGLREADSTMTAARAEGCATAMSVVPCLRVLGRAYNKLGQYHYAHDALQVAIWESNEYLIGPEIERAYMRYHLGVACEALGMNIKANSAYLWAVEFAQLTPGHEAEAARFQRAWDALAHETKQRVVASLVLRGSACQIV